MGRSYAGYGRFVRAAGSSARSHAAPLSSRAFFNLLRRRGSAPDEDADAAIESRCVAELAVLACDSSGFSRKTQDYGILQFLAVMTECYDALIPLIEQRGHCLSHNADNLLAVFPDSAGAARTALDMNRWLSRRNRGLPEARQFHICCGIHCGSLLLLKDNVFGNTVNAAAKIGEDVARRGEILATARAAEGLRGRFRLRKAPPTRIGELDFRLYRVL